MIMEADETASAMPFRPEGGGTACTFSTRRARLHGRRDRRSIVWSRRCVLQKCAPMMAISTSSAAGLPRQKRSGAWKRFASSTDSPVWRYPLRLRSAQYFFMRADWAFRAAADIPLRPRRGMAVAAGMVPGFLGGLPRRFRGPWRASRARLSRSRSATSTPRMSLLTVFDGSTGLGRITGW